jgi:hypothetical protein
MAAARLIEPATVDNSGLSDHQQAVDRLQNMFPTIDQELIQSALNHNQDALEATVDYLVALTQGDTVRLLSSQNEELGGPPRYVEAPPQELDTVQPVAPQKALSLNAFSDSKVKKTSKYTKRPLSFSKKKGEESLMFLYNQSYTGKTPLPRIGSLERGIIILCVHTGLSDEEEPDFSDVPVRSKSESVGEKLVRTLSLSRRKQTKADPFSVTPSLKHDLLDKEDKSEDDDDDELGLTRGYHQVRLC